MKGIFRQNHSVTINVLWRALLAPLFLLSTLYAAPKGGAPPRPPPPPKPEVRRAPEPPPRPSGRIGPEKASAAEMRRQPMSFDPRQSNGPRGDPSKAARSMEAKNSFTGSQRMGVEARLKDKAGTDRANLNSVKATERARLGQVERRSGGLESKKGVEFNKGAGTEGMRGRGNERSAGFENSKGKGPERSKSDTNGLKGKAERVGGKDFAKADLKTTGKERSSGSESKTADAIGRIEAKQRLVDSRRAKSDLAAKERRGNGTEATKSAESGRDVSKRGSDVVARDVKSKGAEAKQSESRRNAETTGKERQRETRERIDSLGRQMESRRREASDRRGADTIAKIESKGRNGGSLVEAKRSSSEVSRRGNAKSFGERLTSERRISYAEQKLGLERSVSERSARMDTLRSERGLRSEFRERKDLAHGHGMLLESHKSAGNQGVSDRVSGHSQPLGVEVLHKGGSERLDSPIARSGYEPATSTGIVTPYGVAIQSNKPAAQAARTLVLEGATLYKIGTAGRSETLESQFWALEHPSTPGFASRYGIPPENMGNADFIQTGRIKPGTSFITRVAPGVGTNLGGGIEIVVPPGGVMVGSFLYKSNTLER